MLKDPKKNKEIKDFLHSQKDLLVFVADPRTDEMIMAFADNFAVVQFPFERIDKGIVFNALRQSKFQEAIDPFMAGIEKATGITVEDNQQLAHIIGGSIKSIGDAIEANKDKYIKESDLLAKKKKNAKSKKG
jgi:hypothetical protein